LDNNGLQRFSQVSIFKNADVTYEIDRTHSEDPGHKLFTLLIDNKIVIFAKNIILQYGDYFSSDFLLGNLAKPYRYATPGAGLLTFADIIFLVAGLIQLSRGNKNYLPLILLLLAPLPAALTIEDSPNLARAFFMIPFLIIIESYGIEMLLRARKFRKIVFFICLALALAGFSYFEYTYFFHSKSHTPFIYGLVLDSSSQRGVGEIELASLLDKSMNKYEKIVVTYLPDSPYPWFAFFTGKDPAEFNKSRIGGTNEHDYKNIIFSETGCPSDYAFKKYSGQKILVVDPAGCPYEAQIKDGLPGHVLSKIFQADGSEVYAVLENN
jgi:hypothetical protein